MRLPDGAGKAMKRRGIGENGNALALLVLNQPPAKLRDEHDAY
jgi:hypothetical protein